MPILILGLVIFLGAHSVRIVADGWRARTIARLGVKKWKTLYSIVSLIGFGLLVYGFGLARHTPVLLYAPPLALKHLNALFTLVAFVLFFASHAPPNHFRAWLHHPMAAAVVVWAAGHLMATGFVHDIVLFGAFFVWGVADFLAGRRRDRVEKVQYAAGTAKGDIGAVVIGVIVWALFAFWLHRLLIGVNPMV